MYRDRAVNATGRVVIRPASECRPGREAASGLRVAEAAAARPSRADAPRNLTIRQNARLGDSAIR